MDMSLNPVFCGIYRDFRFEGKGKTKSHVIVITYIYLTDC